MGKKLRRTRGCSPIARPRTSPIATANAKATASSNRVNCSAAGTPRVRKTVSSEATTCDGGLKNNGSTNQRAAISHNARSAAMTKSRTSHGGRVRPWTVKRRAEIAAAILVLFPARFECRYDSIEGHRDSHNENHVCEHAGHFHRLGEMHDSVAEPSE